MLLLPGSAWAAPIFHAAPQWPGGGLNGSEAARTARHATHPGRHHEYDDETVDGEGAWDAPASDPVALAGDSFEDVSRLLDQLGVSPRDGVPAMFPSDLGGSGSLLSAQASVTSVPEPASILLIGTGIVGVAAKRNRRRNRPTG
jgi:hypothetical protein